MCYSQMNHCNSLVWSEVHGLCSLAPGCNPLYWEEVFLSFRENLIPAHCMMISMGCTCLCLSMCKHGQACTHLAPHASGLIGDLSPCCLAWCTPSPWGERCFVHPKFSTGNASASHRGAARTWHPSSMTSVQPLSPSEATFHHS